MTNILIKNPYTLVYFTGMILGLSSESLGFTYSLLLAAVAYPITTSLQKTLLKKATLNRLKSICSSVVLIKDGVKTDPITSLKILKISEHETVSFLDPSGEPVEMYVNQITVEPDPGIKITIAVQYTLNEGDNFLIRYLPSDEEGLTDNHPL